MIGFDKVRMMMGYATAGRLLCSGVYIVSVLFIMIRYIEIFIPGIFREVFERVGVDFRNDHKML